MGHTWITLTHILGLAIVIFIPAIIVAASMDELAREIDTRLLFAANVVGNTVFSYAILIFTLALIVLYGELKKLPNPKK